MEQNPQESIILLFPDLKRTAKVGSKAELEMIDI